MSDSNENDGFDAEVLLTAYALGEADEAQRAEVEKRLATDADARRVVEEIRATASLVTSELAREGGAALTAEQRAKIASRAASPAKPPFRMRRIHWIGAAAAAAAIVAATPWLTERREKEVADTNAINAKNVWRYAGSGGGGGNTERGVASGAFTYAGGSGVDGELIDRDAIPTMREAKAPYTTGDRARGMSGNLGGGNGGDEFKLSGDSKAQAELNERLQKPRVVNQTPPNGESFVDPEPDWDGSVNSPTPIAGGKGGPGAPGGIAAKPGEPRLGDAPIAGTPLQRDGRDFSGLFEQKSATESYAHVDDNPFRLVKDSPLSTFGVDVDTASYSNVRRFLMEGRLPPPGAVRIEEMINYFPYDYAPPTDGRPFAVHVDVAGCPWQTEHRLVRVGIKGKVVEAAARPASNLVFLIDVSGSMNEPAKLPLLVESMKLMVEKLEPRDRVAMVVYAGSSGLVLPSTPCTEKDTILAALDHLQAGGSTNGGAGIELAYATAAANKIDGGINRVVLATDGDFNVGVTDESSLVKMIEEKAKSGVFLSVLGFGSGNYKDAQMEKLADRGNGNYAYVDSLQEGKKALVDQMSGTLVTIAKDVKLQVEFNPAQVGAYRLIGYENRVLEAQDFKDDRKDAGEIGAGHTVTALYEIVPPGQLTQTAGVDPLKYQQPHAGPRTVDGVDAQSLELLTVKLRWKEPDSDVSTPMEVPVIDEGMTYSQASPDFKFAASVAAFGMLLRGSPYRGQANADAVLELAMEGCANDPSNLRMQFIELAAVMSKLTGK